MRSRSAGVPVRPSARRRGVPATAPARNGSARGDDGADLPAVEGHGHVGSTAAPATSPVVASARGMSTETTSAPVALIRSMRARSPAAAVTPCRRGHRSTSVHRPGRRSRRPRAPTPGGSVRRSPSSRRSHHLRRRRRRAALGVCARTSCATAAHSAGEPPAEPGYPGYRSSAAASPTLSGSASGPGTARERRRQVRGAGRRGDRVGMGQGDVDRACQPARRTRVLPASVTPGFSGPTISISSGEQDPAAERLADASLPQNRRRHDSAGLRRDSRYACSSA